MPDPIMDTLRRYLEKEIGGGSVTMDTLPIRTIPECRLPALAKDLASLSRPAGDEGVREDGTMTAVPTDNTISTLAPNKVQPMTSTTQDDLADELEERARKLAGGLEYPIERTLEWKAAAELRSLRARVGELESLTTTASTNR